MGYEGITQVSQMLNVQHWPAGSFEFRTHNVQILQLVNFNITRTAGPVLADTDFYQLE